MSDTGAAVPSFDITGQAVLVTGASSGIGQHFAEVLAAAGAKVALAARRTERLAELAHEIETRGGECLPVTCDVTDRQSIVAAIQSEDGRRIVVALHRSGHRGLRRRGSTNRDQRRGGYGGQHSGKGIIVSSRIFRRSH